MINKVELGSVNINKITPKYYVSKTQNVELSFGGAGDSALKRMAQKAGKLTLKGVQKCEESPMINVAVLDMLTAILPRTFLKHLSVLNKKMKTVMKLKAENLMY